MGSARPSKRKAARQLAVSDRIAEEIKKLIADAFAEVNDRMRGVRSRWRLGHEPPVIRVGDHQRDRLRLDIRLEPAFLQRLDAAGGIEMGFPHDMLATEMARSFSFGDMRDP